MQSNDILLVCFISCWALITIIFGIIAFIKKPKYKKLKDLNNDLKNKLAEYKNFNLKEIKIDFDLPKDQKCFYKLEDCLLKYSSSKKIDEDNHLLKQKKFFRKNKFNNIKTNIYVTNLFIVFEFQDEFIKIAIDQLNYFYFNYIFLNKEWVLYLNLYFLKTKFILKTEDTNFYFTIKKILEE